ncbi:IS200/IS605 family transposase [Gloeocapsa sp. PCC 73106]|uniref:IS200/IS605 family transposase n=1 Tax=Gloeocapsa sp. PCC 73106 TaxID=102232 RepID=UPI0008FBE02A
MSEIRQDVCNRNNSRLIEFNGENDHCHLLVDMAPNNNISVLIKSLKSASSMLIRKEFTSYLKQFYWKPVFWSSSYFVSSSGGVSLDVLKKYIQNQQVRVLARLAFIPRLTSVGTSRS